MSFMCQKPVAITGLGLLHGCFRTDSHQRFIRVEQTLHVPESVSRSVDLALSATLLACDDNTLKRESCGVAVTISKGLIDVLEECVVELNAGRGQHIPPISECGADAAACEIARSLELGGPAAAAVAACASGLASVKLGMDWLRDGICETVLVGAAESSNSEMVLRSFERLGVISESGVTRPFDARRDGFLVGEGAAVLRLENIEAATFNAARGFGPPILGAVSGIAFGADGFHLTTPDLSGEVLARVIALALERAGLEPRQIDWIHAHGTATAYNDPVEIAALRRVFGRAIPPVTATKGLTGHLLGASGAVALGITLESLRAGIVPPIVGLDTVAAEFFGVDFVRTPRVLVAEHALVLNYGFGGHIAAAVLSVAKNRDRKGAI